MDKDKLAAAGIDYAAGVGIFSGNEDLYVRFLRKFPEDTAIEALKQRNASEKDVRAAAHTLKGTSAALGMKDFSEACAQICRAIDAGESYQIDKALAMYDQAVAAILSE